jgi:hypothetical protein
MRKSSGEIRSFFYVRNVAGTILVETKSRDYGCAVRRNIS